MKTNIFGLFIFCILTSAAIEANETEETLFYDNFPGTILRHSGQLILKRCDLAVYEYPLHFKYAQDQNKIEQYLKKYPKFWVNIRGDVHEEKERYHLTVEDVTDLHPNQSCHLLDFFKD